MIYFDIIKYTFHSLHTIQKNYFIITFLNKKKKKSIILSKYKKNPIPKKISFSIIFKLFLLKLFKLSKIFLDVIKNKEIFKCLFSTETSYI